jgi:hypothetical protein
MPVCTRGGAVSVVSVELVLRPQFTLSLSLSL